MPNRKQHKQTGQIIGAFGGAITYSAYVVERQKANPFYQPNLIDFALFVAGGTLLGEAAGVLPDILEPGTNSHHRNTCHSLAAATSIIYGMNKAANSNLSSFDKAVINITGSSYLSHLLMDAETPRGLPLIGR